MCRSTVRRSWPSIFSTCSSSHAPDTFARAHSHSADPRLVSGYCGKNEELDEAMAAFAVAYADRTEADHSDLVAAVRAGRIAAEAGV